MSYDPTIYEGAAAHYRAGRPPYSPRLEAVLTDELGLDGSGRLLDGGCGPGILTLRLAPLFDETVGLDPDPAMLAHTVQGRPVPPSPGPPPIPHAEIEALVEKYLGPGKRDGRGPAPVLTHRFEDVLVRTRFGEPEAIFAPGVPDLVRDTESVASGYFSFSWAAPHLFGDRVEEFAAELRALLADRAADGVFWDWPGDTEIVLARKRKRAG
jgi:SAM-dependent methyltransferase